MDDYARGPSLWNKKGKSVDWKVKMKISLTKNQLDCPEGGLYGNINWSVITNHENLIPKFILKGREIRILLDMLVSHEQMGREKSNECQTLEICINEIHDS